MRLLMLLSLLLCYRVTVAQNTFVGMKAGGHIGSAYIDHTIFPNSNNAGFKNGVHAGVMVKYFPKKRDVFLKSGLQFSFNYVQKGWRQLFLNAEPAYEAQMTYLELPIEAIGYFGNKLNFFITAGFYFEYLIDYELGPLPTLDDNLADGRSLVGGQDFYTFEPERDNRAGYGARASGGFFTNLPFGMVHIEGFFSYSISNFLDPGDLTTRIPDLSNLWTTGVSIGYLIDLNKKKDL